MQLGLTSSSDWWSTGWRRVQACSSFFQKCGLMEQLVWMFICLSTFVDICALMYLIRLEAWILTVRRPKRIWSKNRCNIFTILRECNTESTNIFFCQWKFFYQKEICLFKGRMISKYCESWQSFEWVFQLLHLDFQNIIFKLLFYYII